MSSVALAVVTRDRPGLIARCLLPSLRAMDRCDADVLVVDQSDDSETHALIQELPWVRYARSGPGVSRGRNVAVEASSAPVIVFTDDDVEFGPDWLARMRAAIAEPDVGAVCGRGTDSSGRTLPGGRAGVHRWPSDPFNLGHGFNVAFRRAALLDAGPFDELLGGGAPIPAAEDTDMLYRVLRGGWAVICDDSIIVRHRSWRSVEEERRVHANYGAGFAAQTVKHVRRGDRVAARLAAQELGRHAFWTAVAVARRDRRTLRLQAAWARGALAGRAQATKAYGRDAIDRRPSGH
jgi:GT2 family glycosyltransferase